VSRLRSLTSLDESGYPPARGVFPSAPNNSGALGEEAKGTIFAGRDKKSLKGGGGGGFLKKNQKAAGENQGNKFGVSLTWGKDLARQAFGRLAFRGKEGKSGGGVPPLGRQSRRKCSEKIETYPENTSPTVKKGEKGSCGGGATSTT